jgi:type III pantothenate kinase
VGTIHETLELAKVMHQPIDRIWIDGGNAKNIVAELQQHSFSHSISIETINGLVLRGLWSWIRQELR